MARKRVSTRIFRAVLRRLSLERKYDGIKEYVYDFNRFCRHSSSLDPQMSHAAAAARLTKEYHRIEKGLALPEPRPGFAQPVVDWLMQEVPRLESAAGPGLATRGSRGSVRAWVEYHDRIGFEVDPRIRSFVQGAENLPGGAVTLTKSAIQDAAMIDFARFAKSRYSVRQFTGEPVAETAIRAAVAVALKTPRVCNRESRRVHVAYTPEARKRMLDQQNGNAGFGHLAGAVLMITTDVRSFTDFGERNQMWVDGGMFAMTLAHALHAQGLGTCMLNSATLQRQDRKLRAALGLADHEAVITFMAVGQLPSQVEVAISPAPEPEEILRVLG